MALAVIAFLVVLAVIATERMHRTKIALLGAAVVVLFTGSQYDQELAIEAVDFNTIGLLVGMMILVHLTQQTGVYDYIAIKAGQLSKGRPAAVVFALAGTTALLSAFLDNLTTILLVVPVTFLLADALDLDPIPLVIIEVIASNIGGTATLIGDPPNIIIAGATDLSFNDFIVNLAPAVLVVTILFFFAHQALHIEPATVALSGAAVGLLVTRQDLDESLAKIEWSTLFFFVALFVMVGALEATGAIEEVANAVKDATGGDRTAELLGITWISGIGSGIVDNIPFTTAMIPVVESLQGGADDDAYWWALSLGACFGGNMTVIAAAANVAASGLAERAGKPITFMAFFRVGLPVTLISLLIATAYISVRYIAI
jgi:Na+/H+ antiporter NhaD/arsenite permease-like protein